MFVIHKCQRSLFTAGDSGGSFTQWCCLSVWLSVAWNAYTKTWLSQKLSSLELWPLLTINSKSYIGFSKNSFLDLWNLRWRTATILKIAKLLYLNEKSCDFDDIWYTVAD